MDAATPDFPAGIYGTGRFQGNCPVCGRKELDEAVCPRCRAELTVFGEIDNATEEFKRTAARALEKDGDAARALSCVEKSWFLKKNADAARIACIASFALGDHDGILRWYGRCGKNTDDGIRR